MVENNNIFNIQPYLDQINGAKYKIKNLSDIGKVHSSKEYSRFINDLYTFYNKYDGEKTNSKKNQHNNNAIKTVINSFWRDFLGADLVNKYITRLHDKSYNE